MTSSGSTSVRHFATSHSDSGSDSTGDPIFTPDSEERLSPALLPQPPKRRSQPSSLRVSSLPLHIKEELHPVDQLAHNPGHEEDEGSSESDFDLDNLDEMTSSRPPMHRPTDGRSQVPLLKDEERGRGSVDSPDGSARPPFAARRSTFRSRSPTYVEPVNTTRQKYVYASFALLLSLISFVVQTETAVYIQHDLGWKKAYCMLYLTHGSWSLLWPTQLLILRIQKRDLAWPVFWRRHKYLLRTTAKMVETQQLHLTSATSQHSPVPYMLRTTAFVTIFLTIAGGSWYVAVDLTSPSDLTAIYNCSAFFAYVFSILLLKDKLRVDKMVSVAVAIVGVLVVAYGDKAAPAGTPDGVPGSNDEASNRTLGNLIIGVGSVLYGLYEVLYKKLACPPEGTNPGRGMIFATTFGSLIGIFTLTVLWIPLPILHYTGIETFELPRGKAARLLAVSTLSNAVFSGSFLVLMSLTSPVLGSVAALLTIFLVAVTDWFITGVPLSAAALTGGTLIVAAFTMLSWATYREMDQERQKRESEEGVLVDDSEDDEVHE